MPVGLARRSPTSTGSWPATPSASWRPGRTGVRHYGEHGEARERRRVSRVHRVVRAAAADADLRRGRLHRRAGPGGQGPRLPGHGVRRPRGLRHQAPVPDGRRGRRRLAATACSSGSAPSLGPRDAVCVLTHDPKFDVPAIVAALRDRRRLHRRDGQPAHRTPSGSSGCARRASTTPALGPGHGADRARHRRPHPRGDRRLDLRRDHRPAHRHAPCAEACATRQGAIRPLSTYSRWREARRP